MSVTVDGVIERRHAVTGRSAAFVFAPQAEALVSARIGADVEGAAVVDLEPNGQRLDPGDLVVIVDDITPVRIRHS